jgi:protein ImuB
MFAVLFLPKFRLQAALRWQEELAAQAVAITGENNVVLEATEAAERRHVTVGLNAVQALARCADVALRPRSVAMEEVLHSTLLEIAGSLSPEIEATSAGCATVDLRGARIGHWNEWAQQVVERFRSLELNAQVGVGPNADLAFIAARKARPALVVQTPTAFLAQLALTEIDPPPHLQALLRDWGIHTLGQLTSLPRGEFADRLGPDCRSALAASFGTGGAPVAPGSAERGVCGGIRFLSARSRPWSRSFSFCGGSWISSRSGSAACHRVAAQMTLTLPLEDRRTTSVCSRSLRRQDQAEVLFRILHTHLESLQMSARPIGRAPADRLGAAGAPAAAAL